MPCIGLWRRFVLIGHDGIPVFPESRIRVTPAAPPAGRISSVVLNAADVPIETTRRMGVCVPVPGAPNLSNMALTLVHPTSSREFITTGFVAPANAPESDFIGAYEAPDTGDTGTGSGSQGITVLTITVTTEGGDSAVSKAGSRKTGSRKAGSGSTKGASAKGTSTKGTSVKGAATKSAATKGASKSAKGRGTAKKGKK